MTSPGKEVLCLSPLGECPITQAPSKEGGSPMSQRLDTRDGPRTLKDFPVYL